VDALHGVQVLHAFADLRRGEKLFLDRDDTTFNGTLDCFFTLIKTIYLQVQVVVPFSSSSSVLHTKACVHPVNSTLDF
jgi:hypothetical protein